LIAVNVSISVLADRTITVELMLQCCVVLCRLSVTWMMYW